MFLHFHNVRSAQCAADLYSRHLNQTPSNYPFSSLEAYNAAISSRTACPIDNEFGGFCAFMMSPARIKLANFLTRPLEYSLPYSSLKLTHLSTILLNCGIQEEDLNSFNIARIVWIANTLEFSWESKVFISFHGVYLFSIIIKIKITKIKQTIITIDSNKWIRWTDWGANCCREHFSQHCRAVYGLQRDVTECPWSHLKCDPKDRLASPVHWISTSPSLAVLTRRLKVHPIANPGLRNSIRAQSMQPKCTGKRRVRMYFEWFAGAAGPMAM